MTETKSKWERSEFQIHLRDINTEKPYRIGRRCYVNPDVPGLCVHWHGDGFNVSHVESGLSIATGFYTQQGAAKAARAFAALGDWTRTSDEILEDKPFLLEAKRLRKHYADENDPEAWVNYSPAATPAEAAVPGLPSSDKR
jgi:hypothetical protein